MVSVCLPSDALLQHLPSYLGFSYLGRGVSLHSCSSKAQPMLLTLDEGYLLTAALPDLKRGIASLGPPVPAQPRHRVGPPGHHPCAVTGALKRRREMIFRELIKVKWRRQWQPTPVLLPRKSHGRRSLVGCSPWGHEESDTY